MFSLRVSVHRNVRPVERASEATSTSSAARPLPPKPPPTSGAITRTCSGSIPSIPASPSRSWWGVWVDSHTVSRPCSSTIAAVDRGSTGHTARRWLTLWPYVTTSQSANRFSSASSGWCRHTLVPTSSYSSISSRTASVIPVTAGSGS